MRKQSMARQIRIHRLQNKNHMGGKAFTTLGENERHKMPWLGSVWFEEGMEAERLQFIKEWQEETERLLLLNPHLKIV